MAQIHMHEFEFKAKCCAEKLYALMTRDAPKIPKYVPKIVHRVQVLPADGEVLVGSIFIWDYVQGDTPSAVTTKEKITAVDHKNKSITYTVFEGYLINDYPSFAFNLTITPLQRDANYKCLVKYSVKYEKANADVPDPTHLMKLLEDFSKELDTNLLKEA
ncbi:hypothetical protein MKX03_022500 [Papaver bracteatum]|nr:hypothetical protein MKX03_022500 [Papaver bracteatum]